MNGGDVILNTLNFYYNQGYSYRFIYDNNESNFYDFYLVPPNMSSGDFSGDLIYNGNNNNNNIDILQQNQENQNFWVQAYNNLFTISGDYVTQKFNELREENLISGDYEIEEQVINIIQNQANDFIISWEDSTTHFTIGGQNTSQITIPQNQINFSLMERQNEDLHNVMIWARTIIGFSLGMLLLRNYWTTFLLMLGIGIQVYDKTDDEKATITITTDAKGNKTTTKTMKLGNITQKWINKK